MILYCDCFSGISGDMFLGGLVDLGLPIDLLQEELTKLKISFLIQAEKVTKRAIQATQVIITDPEEHHHHTHHPDHHHHHRPAKELVRILQESDLSSSIKEKSISLLWKIAQAEGSIHGQNLKRFSFTKSEAEHYNRYYRRNNWTQLFSHKKGFCLNHSYRLWFYRNCPW